MTPPLTEREAGGYAAHLGTGRFEKEQQLREIRVWWESFTQSEKLT